MIRTYEIKARIKVDDQVFAADPKYFEETFRDEFHSPSYGVSVESVDITDVTTPKPLWPDLTDPRGRGESDCP